VWEDVATRLEADNALRPIWLRGGKDGTIRRPTLKSGLTGWDNIQSIGRAMRLIRIVHASSSCSPEPAAYTGVFASRHRLFTTMFACLAYTPYLSFSTRNASQGLISTVGPVADALARASRFRNSWFVHAWMQGSLPDLFGGLDAATLRERHGEDSFDCLSI
jgi:hypothetical protein